MVLLAALAMDAASGITYAHVKAHTGNPWNECADWLCSEHAECLPEAHVVFPQGLRSDPKKLIWTHKLEQQSVQLPPRDTQGVVVISQPRVPTLSPALAITSQPSSSPAAGGERVEFGLSCITANVRTLRPVELAEAGVTSVVATTRMAALQEVFNTKSPNLVAVQESRVRKPGLRHLASFFCFVSGALATGQCGCELWISKEHPIEVEGRLVYPKPAHFTVVHSDPRRLVVSWQILGAVMDVAVLHAPTSKARSATRAKWWQETEDILVQGRPRGRPCLLLADANAHLGSSLAEGIGPHCQEQEDEAGSRLASLVKEVGVFLPQTFADNYKQSDGHTWVSNLGGRHRNDYIGVPLAWRASTTASVDYGADIAEGNADHFLVHASCRAELAAANQLAVRRLPVACRAALKDPTRVAVLRQALVAIPAIPWQVHADDHLVLINSWVRTVMETVAPVTKTAPRKPWISPKTAQLIVSRAHCRGVARRTAARIDVLTAKVVLAAWARVRVCALGDHTWCREPGCCCVQCPRRQAHLQDPATHVGQAGERDCANSMGDSLSRPAPSSNQWLTQLAASVSELPGRTAQVRALRCQTLPAARHLCRAERATTASVRADRKNHVLSIATEAQNAAAAGDTRLLYHLTRQLAPHEARTWQMVKDAQGMPIADPLRARTRWFEHFAEAFKGEPTSFEDLQRAALEERARPGMMPLANDMDIALTPTWQDAAITLAKKKSGKAAGEDGIVPELAKAAPDILAHILEPLYAKAVLRIEEPVLWMGLVHPGGLEEEGGHWLVLLLPGHCSRGPLGQGPPPALQEGHDRVLQGGLPPHPVRRCGLARL